MTKKIASIYLILLVVLFNISGCHSKYSEVSTTQTPYYTVDIDGNKIYLKEDVPKVYSAKETCVGFIIARLNRDYRNFDSKAEYKYFSKETYKKYMDEKFYEVTEKNYKQNLLSFKYDSHRVEGIKFFSSDGKERCEAYLTYKNIILSASESFLKENKVELNEKYQRSAKVYMVFEDNAWKVTDWELGPMNK